MEPGKWLTNQSRRNVLVVNGLVARGFTQREGIDFKEVFLPVVKHCSIRVLLNLVGPYNMEFDHLVVKSTFLNGELEKTIYMTQREGFRKLEGSGKVPIKEVSVWFEAEPKPHMTYDTYWL